MEDELQDTINEDSENVELVNEEVSEDGAQSEVETDTQDNVQHEKVFTQEEVDNIISARVNRVERDYRKQLKEQEGVMSILKSGLGKDNIQDIEGELRKFYKDQGVDIPESKRYDDDDERILAKAYASDIISSGEDEMRKVASEIANKPYEQRSVREIEMLNILGKELMDRKETNELKSKGQDVSVLNNRDFKEFRNKLSTKVSVGEALELFNKLNSSKIEKPKNPGSATSSHTESKFKDYYTSEEVDNLSAKDLDNPKIFKAVMNSMKKW